LLSRFVITYRSDKKILKLNCLKIAKKNDENQMMKVLFNAIVILMYEGANI